MLLFRTSEEKALESLVYLANRWGGFLPSHIAHKVFFLAEKEHLLDWGRPIFGDTYIAMRDYPIGMMTRDIIEGNYISYEINKEIFKSIKVNISDDNYYIENLRPVNMDNFSKSDIQTLDKVAKKFSCIGDQESKNIFSLDPAFSKTNYREIISYEDFFPNDFENKESVIQQMKENIAFGAMFN